MKVLLLDVNCKYGSTGKIVYDLYTKLNKDGDIAAIGYGRGAVVKEKNILKISPRWEMYLHAFLTRVTGRTGCFSNLATRRLLRFMDDFKPDVVHLHELHGYYVNIFQVMDYLKRRNIKTVWTFHCEFMYTGKCGYGYECNKWQENCGHCPQLNGYPRSFWFDCTSRMHQEKKESFSEFDNLYIVTPSRWLEERVRKSFLKDKNIKTIHNGIDTENIFYPRKTNELCEKLNLKGKKVILAVAPDLMSERKGGRWVLKLADKMKEEEIVFILIGVETKKTNCGKNVILMSGIREQDLLAQYYSLADLFVICSERENFPTTCIEAISCGTPVVGFNTGGTAETAPEGLGTFVPYGDVDALKKAALQMLDKKDRKELCSSFGRENYSAKRMFLEYKTLYCGSQVSY